MSIQQLNDALRTSFRGGRVVTTSGVADMPDTEKADLIDKVRRFDGFTEDNDPHGDHDFGSIDVLGETYFWKIDYYDLECVYGSDDPADPSKTMRVLTIMHANEY